MSSDTPASGATGFSGKLKDYMALSKFTLSITVVFSSVLSYLLAPVKRFDSDLLAIVLVSVGGMLVTSSANAMNQIAEKNTDALMKRTAKRPIASGRMGVREATVFAVAALAIGVFIMYLFNWQAALLSVFSWFLYSYIYTPLKKVSAISVLVGAFPGAFPCLIGWVAATGEFSMGGWVLFIIQFLWQFPHFWAIAWVAHNDYDKAGFKLLPNQNKPSRNTALQAIAYSMVMVPFGFLPSYVGMSGSFSMWLVLAANLAMIIQCVRLYMDMDVKAARRVMFSSYIYLPVVLISLYADKIG